MNKSFLVLAMLALVTLGGCATKAQDVGTAGGAIAGGAIGSSVSGGSTLGTLGGAAAGAYVGDEAGKYYNQHH